MRAQDFMTHPAITVHVNDPLNLAAQRMWDHDCGALAVVNDEGKLVGMITDRDICMAALMQNRSLDNLLVNVGMAKHVVSAKPLDRIGDVERLMAIHQIRRIPIVNDSDKPIGVVSLNDLAMQRDDQVLNTLAAVCRHRLFAEA